LVIEEERVGEKDLAQLLKPYPNAKQIGVNPVVAQLFPTLPTSVTPKGRALMSFGSATKPIWTRRFRSTATEDGDGSGQLWLMPSRRPQR
jgi:hypothetical protein